MTPRVSVVMLTFNRPQYISRAIESIIDQSVEDWELVVVHDGPNQEIERILRDWERRESRIQYVRRPKGGNIAEATNCGIRLARGRYIAILDDDDYWLSPDKLGRQIEFLESRPDYACCGGGAVCIGSDGGELFSYHKPEQDAQIKKQALLANPMIHSTTLYRRELAQAAGLYDESLAGFQDWDFFLRLGRLGRLYNFQENFLAYQIWEGGGSFEAQRRNTESALRIVRRHRRTYGRPALALALASAYYAYARLPLAVRRNTFSSLTKLKKLTFAHRPQYGQPRRSSSS